LTDTLPRAGCSVKWSAPHSGQILNASIAWFCVSIDPTCLVKSAVLVEFPTTDVTCILENIRIVLNGGRRAHLGTFQV
jgi:hypothetical protein